MCLCMDVLMEGQERLGGRLVLAECKPIPHLLAFYQRHGFDVIKKSNNGVADGLLKLVRILDERS